MVMKKLLSEIKECFFNYNLNKNKDVVINYIKNKDTIYDFGTGDCIVALIARST